jgi:hypothetical protein
MSRNSKEYDIERRTKMTEKEEDNAQRNQKSFLCLLSEMVKELKTREQNFGRLDLLYSPLEGRETATLLGPLDGANSVAR